jgi:hypothetical protein
MMESSKQPFAFISYSRSDAVYVDRLAEYLKAEQIAVWLDRAATDPNRWALEIRDQIDRCAAFILVRSPAADRSGWVRREVQRAIEQTKPVLQLQLDSSPSSIDRVVSAADALRSAMPAPTWLEQLHKALKACPVRHEAADTGAFFAGSDVSTADFANGDLRQADMEGTSLRGARLRGVRFTHATARNAELRFADLQGVELSGTDLRGANLSHVSLAGARLIGTDLSGANLSGADLRGTDLTRANLDGAVLENSISDEHTRWPEQTSR